MLCPVCEKWELGPTDSYCSWCSEKVRALTLVVAPRVFIAGRGDDTAQLTVTNNGSAGAVTVKRVWSDRPEWLRPDDDAARGRELGTGEALVVELGVDTSDLPDGFHAGSVFVETEDNGTWEAAVTVSPVPAWDLAQPPPLYFEDGQKQVELPLSLVVERGLLTPEEIKAAADGWAEVLFDGRGVTLDSRGNSSHDFSLLVHTDRMPRDGAGQPLDKYEVELRLEFAELLIGGSKTVRFKYLQPPQLVIAEQTGEALQLEVFRGETQKATLHVQNGFGGEAGRSALRIRGVHASREWLRLKTELPLTIESGKAATLDFDITGDRVAGAEERATLVLEAEPWGKNDGRLALSVVVRVREKAPYAGWLCIDFGTTNTCVGRSEPDKDGNPQLIVLDTGQQTVASSVIQYHDLKDGNRVYAVGSTAYDELYRPEAEGTVFDQIKRRLGRPEDGPLDVRFLNRKHSENEPIQKLYPREIAADIFRRLLATSEEKLRAKVEQCVISHPSRVSRLQLKDLRDALAEAFKPHYDIPAENIKLYHEPVAAAVDYLMTQSEGPPRAGDYHLMVYDFGGGTTDIALLRVKEKVHPKRGRIVRPEVLTVDGDPALGGEDVTDMLMRLYHAKIERREFPDGESPRYANLRLPIDAEQETDSLIKKKARENHGVLRRLAERQKIALAEALRARQESLLTSLVMLPAGLTYILDGKLVTNVVSAVEPVAHEEFNAGLARMIDPSVQKMVELLGKVGLREADVSLVLLSGQSSAFPVVGETIRQRLGLDPEKVQTLRNPKECVVRGLCALQSDELTAGLAVMVEMQGCLSAATSRLGLRVTDRGQRKFKELIGAGTPIGPEGYAREVEGVVFKRNTALPLYEHMGPATDDSFSEGDSRIKVVKIFRLSDKLAEMGEEGQKITDDILFDAALWFTIDANHQVGLEIRFAEEENLRPIKFEATYAGY